MWGEGGWRGRGRCHSTPFSPISLIPTLFFLVLYCRWGVESIVPLFLQLPEMRFPDPSMNIINHPLIVVDLFPIVGVIEYVTVCNVCEVGPVVKVSQIVYSSPCVGDEF